MRQSEFGADWEKVRSRITLSMLCNVKLLCVRQALGEQSSLQADLEATRGILAQGDPKRLRVFFFPPAHPEVRAPLELPYFLKALYGLG